MPESASSRIHQATVTFGRPITEADLKALQKLTDVLEARAEPIDVDSDHVHGSPAEIVRPGRVAG